MIRIDEALKIILDVITPLPAEEIRLTEGLGRVLAEDIHSDTSIPLSDNSAMDGYAVRAADTEGASHSNPKILRVAEDVRAGYLATKKVEDSVAIRIMTGAVIPEGADSVIMVEDTEKEDREKVKIFKEAKEGDNIRRAGEDIKKGELALSKGIKITAAHMGILASLGRATINVARKPRIAILATGDEVIGLEEKLEPGKLRSSNTYTLYSQILKSGGIPKNLGISKDTAEELEGKIKEGLDCDMILTSGGVSVGDYDLVKLILAKLGTDIKFWKVAMKPGRPLVFGTVQGIPIFGLPGNPVSSMVSFEVFVRPVILKMLGLDSDSQKEVDAVIEEDVEKKKDLRYFLRAVTRWEDGAYITRTTGPQGSGILKSMACANSLIILPEERTFVKKGTKVTARFL